MTKLREKIGYFDGENNPNYNNIRIKDDDIMYKGGYIWQRKIKHPFATDDGWIRQHRLVAEQYLLTEENSIVINNNRYLSPEYEVHHKDFNRHNNNPNNLTVLTKSEHMKFHQKIKKEGNNIMEIKVKYHNKNINKIEKLEIGDWIDLRSAETITLKQGDFKLISLGISIQLPNGYEAHVVPRSSTFKKWGIIQTNSMGVIDESYCGNNDIWMMPVLAMRDTTIHENDRICQFRIVDKMPKSNIIEIDNLDNEDRGGFGSTGSN